eukprot:3242777-Pyramimonas_sp.AAC.1
MKRAQKASAEHQDRRKPKSFDTPSSLEDSKRKRDEAPLNYVARKRVLFRELEKRATLPEDVKGYLFLRESKLNDAARDTAERWTEGACDFDLAREKIRKLERPRPPPSGRGGHRTHGDDDAREDQESDRDDSHWSSTQQPLLTLREAHEEDESMTEAAKYMDDDEALFAAA